MKVEGDKKGDVVAKGANGRKAMRALTDQKPSGHSFTTPSESGQTIKSDYIALKQTELELKREYLAQKAASKENRDILNLLKTLEKMGQKDSDEYKTMSEKYLGMLRTSVGSATETNLNKRIRTDEYEMERLINNT